jgi:amino acid adenylation domain-containing protein
VTEAPAAIVEAGPAPIPDISAYVERWARTRPDATAVVAGGRGYAWERLAADVRRLAHGLQDHGLGPGDTVISLGARSYEAVVTILALWRLGCAYAPVDPRDTSARTRQVIARVGAKAALRLVGPPEQRDPRMVTLSYDLLMSGPATGPCGLPDPSSLGPLLPAYVIHTSGSSGTPKGVVNGRDGLRRAVGSLSTLQVRARDRVLQYLPLTFDASLFELSLALAAGATLCVAPEGLAPGRALETFLGDTGVTVVATTPSILRTLRAAQVPSVRTIITGGERCDAALVDGWSGGRRFFNVYGPTEVALWTTFEAVVPGLPPGIGHPLVGLRLSIEDEERRPVADGDVGELVVTGPNVALGYLDPAQTAAAFSRTPDGQRQYRTGDLVTRRPDGGLQYAGRADRQVKVRGYRIEPAEIEATLAGLPQVHRCHVATRPDGGDSLVAYVTPSEQLVEHARYSGHIRAVRTMSDREYTATRSWDDAGLAGWRSARGNEPLPPSVVADWLDASARRILAERPRSVLEIGCGAGQLARRLLPALRSYVGVDVAPSGLEAFRRSLTTAAPHPVALHDLPAHEAAAAAPDDLDTVVLNSVIQYFPDETYLRDVLLGLAARFAGPGVLQLGDVRDLRSAADERGAPRTGAGRAREDLDAARRDETELLVHPAWFFRALPAGWRVLCRPRLGSADSEMGRYRYDVTLFCPAPGAGQSADAPDGPAGSWSFTPDVPNARLVGPAGAAGSGPASGPRALDPDDAARLGQPGTWSVAVTSLTDHRAFDIVHAPPGSSTPELAQHVHRRTAALLAGQPDGPAPLVTDPLARELERELTIAVREGAGASLPVHLRPSAIVVLREFPLTPHGKLDTGRLPAAWPPPLAAVPGRTDAERALATAWTDVLGSGPTSYSTPPRDGGATSLRLVELADCLERAGFEVPVQDLTADLPFEQLARLLVPGHQGGAPRLVALRRPAGQRSPRTLVLLHAIGGSLRSYLRLVELLPADVACYAIPQSSDPARTSIPSLARGYRQLLERELPPGPVQLAGWSLGGAIAYEIACRWRRADVEPHLTLLDAPAPLAGADPGREARWRRLRHGGAGLASRLAAGRQSAAAEALVTAFEAYRPPLSTRPVDLVVATGRPAAEADDPLFRRGGALGWEHHAPTRVHPAPGDHFTMLTDPHAATLARLLTGLMAGSGQTV